MSTMKLFSWQLGHSFSSNCGISCKIGGSQPAQMVAYAVELRTSTGSSFQARLALQYGYDAAESFSTENSVFDVGLVLSTSGLRA